jgi:hypothetical protein
MPGIEPGAFHMQSERSTTELHPLDINKVRDAILIYILQNIRCTFVHVYLKHYDVLSKCSHRYKGADCNWFRSPLARNQSCSIFKNSLEIKEVELDR